MTPEIHRLKLFAKRVEQQAERFVSALRTLHDLVASLEGKYPVRITQDDPNSITVDLVAANGYEAGLDLTIQDDLELSVSVIFDGKNRDKRIHYMHGEEAVSSGFKEVLKRLERSGNK